MSLLEKADEQRKMMREHPSNPALMRGVEVADLELKFRYMGYDMPVDMELVPTVIHPTDPKLHCWIVVDAASVGEEAPTHVIDAAMDAAHEYVRDAR